jgi:hypothetical protein
MRRVIVAAFLGFAITLSMTAFAHEGHDKAPGALSAPNGGSIKGTSSYFAEVVYDAGKVKVFVYDHDMKSLKSSSVKVTATVKFPKSSKPAELKLTPSGDALVGTVDAKGAHRFSVNLSIGKDGKSEKVSFNIEP